MKRFIEGVFNLFCNCRYVKLAVGSELGAGFAFDVALCTDDFNGARYRAVLLRAAP